jgi:hypothetical protein
MSTDEVEAGEFVPRHTTEELETKRELFAETKRKKREQREKDEKNVRREVQALLHNYLLMLNIPGESKFMPKTVMVPGNIKFEADKQNGWVIVCRETGVKVRLILSVVPDMSDQELPLKPM